MKTKSTFSRKVSGTPAAPPTADDKIDQVCITYCSSFYDYEECKQVCLSTSPRNLSLYRRALLQAKQDGLSEQHQHLFAAGAVWSWAGGKVTKAE